MIFGDDSTPARSCTLGFTSLTDAITSTHQPVESKFNTVANNVRRSSNLEFDVRPPSCAKCGSSWYFLPSAQPDVTDVSNKGDGLLLVRGSRRQISVDLGLHLLALFAGGYDSSFFLRYLRRDSLLYNGYRLSLPGGKAAGAWR